MEIKSDNLINKDIIQQSNKFDNLNIKNLKEDADLRKVSNDFEAYFLNQILDVSLKDNPIAGEGTGSDIIKSMYLQSISDNSSGSLGISDMLYNFLSKNNKN